jgi:hypothetical protein
MPIEIRELHIKAVIDSGGKKASANSETGAGNETSETGNGINQEQLIDLCVEKVLEILKEKEER